MSNAVRQIVSKKKKRFTEDSFNLDLSYISPQIIAMGVPAETYERIYRNDINEVVRFLETRHCDKYCVYNLCVERAYDVSKFRDRVEQFPMRDHNPPPIHIIPYFCMSVYRWLQKGPDYVAAIHCKAGKGRTGAMVCCYLLFESFHGLHGQPPTFLTASDVLRLYDTKRTHDNKGVTIPSQRRYVFYYAHMLHKQLALENFNLLLTSIVVEGGPPAFQSGSCCLMFKCMKMVRDCGQDNKSTLKTVGESESVEPRRGLAQPPGTFVIRPPAPIAVSGDFKLVFYNRSKLLSRLDKVFHCWLNTFFIVNQPPDTPGALWRRNRADSTEAAGFSTRSKSDRELSLTLTKCELDKAFKDKQHRVYPEAFAITVNFAYPDTVDNGQLDDQFRGFAVGPAASSSSSCSSITDDSDCCDFGVDLPSASALSLSDCSTAARENGAPSASRRLSPSRNHRHAHQHHAHHHRHHHRPNPESSPSPTPISTAPPSATSTATEPAENSPDIANEFNSPDILTTAL